MDFNYSEEQEAVRQLAGQIFSERATHERLKAVEAAAGDEGPIDRDLWRELAGAGLIGIQLGEDVGGAGLDFVAACLVVEAAGRTAAYVPVVETMAYGAVPIDRFGTDAQRKTWLSGVANGETILTGALAELVGEVILPGGLEPTTVAVAQSDGSWRLSGTKACVPASARGRCLLGSRHPPLVGRLGRRHRGLHGRRRCAGTHTDPPNNHDGPSGSDRGVGWRHRRGRPAPRRRRCGRR